MQHAVLDKQKIQITLYIQELFKHFPTLCAVDLSIRNSRKKDLLTGQNENSFTIFLTPYLDLELYQEQTGLSPDLRISYIEDLYPAPDEFYNAQEHDHVSKPDNEKNKRVLDWGDYDDIVSLQSNTHRLDIKDIKGRTFNYKQFANKYLTFHILKNPDFVEEVYYQNQANNATFEAFYKHRFINGNFETFSSFLGTAATALYDKLAVENTLPETKETSTHPFSLERFKI